jgi:uncharacterized Zn finger protein (UPF0148 family)
MPVCPNCSYEYVEGTLVCPDCQTKLVDEEDYVSPEEWTEENWEVVYTSTREYEIRMLKDNLKAAGIDSIILSQKDRNFPAPGDLSVVKLMVHRENLTDAMTYIEQIKDESESGDTEQ